MAVTSSTAPRNCLWLVVVLAAVAILGCSRDNMDYGPMLASAETRGSVVYERNCAACHEAENLPLLKQPPKLKGLFKNKTLPSGSAVTDEQVRKTILAGRATMPPFERTLNENQMNDLLRYLRTL